MRSSFISAVVCTFIVLGLCNDSTCTSDDDDDHCELLQSGVGVLKEHKNEDEKDKGVVNEHKEEGHIHKEHHKEHHKGHKAHEEHKEHEEHKVKTVQHDEGAGWPNIFKDLGKMIAGTSTVKKDAEVLQEKIIAFGNEVKKITMDLLEKAKKADKVHIVVTEVDNAGHKINAAFKLVVDAVAKVSNDFVGGIGALIPSDKFKSFLTDTLKAVKKEGDELEKRLDMELGKVNVSSVCTLAEKKLDKLKAQVETFVNATLGMTPEGMKKEVEALYSMLPDNAKKEVQKFIDKATEAGKALRDSVSEAGKEIYDSIGLALKHQCPNFVNFVPSSAVHVKVGVVTAIVVSAAALTI